MAQPLPHYRRVGKSMKRAALHEDFSRGADVDRSSDRSFGLVIAAFFLIVGLWPIVRGGQLRGWALALVVIFGGLGLAYPRVLAPLNRAWTRLGLLMQQMISPVVLGLLFFVVLTPIAMVMRLIGRQSLHLGFDRDARSYWIERRPPGPAPETMRQQF